MVERRTKASDKSGYCVNTSSGHGLATRIVLVEHIFEGVYILARLLLILLAHLQQRAWSPRQ